MRSAAITIIFILSSQLLGCAGSVKQYSWGARLPTQDRSGILHIELSNNVQNAIPSMQNSCRNLGGLDEKSIKMLNSTNEIRLWIGFSTWEYSCLGVNRSPPKEIQNYLEERQSNIDMTSGKQKCLELGFKAGSEGFGKCVLQLSK
jgi:hypothetical protein